MLRNQIKNQIIKHQFLYFGGNYKNVYSTNKIYLYFKYSNKYILNLKYLLQDLSYFYNIIKNIILKNGKILLLNEIVDFTFLLSNLQKESKLKHFLLFINKWRYGFFTNNVYLKKNKIPSAIYLISLEFNEFLYNELITLKKPIISIMNFEKKNNNSMFYYNFVGNYKEINTHFIFFKILKYYLKKVLKYKKYNFFNKFFYLLKNLEIRLKKERKSSN